MFFTGQFATTPLRVLNTMFQELPPWRRQKQWRYYRITPIFLVWVGMVWYYVYRLRHLVINNQKLLIQQQKEIKMEWHCLWAGSEYSFYTASITSIVKTCRLFHIISSGYLSFGGTSCFGLPIKMKSLIPFLRKPLILELISSKKNG